MGTSAGREKRRKAGAVALSLLFLFLTSGAARSAPPAKTGGMRVEPGELVIKGVPLGEKTSASRLGAEKLKVTNKDGKAHRFTVKVLTTAASRSRLKYGYEDIPDASWLKPGEAESVIGPLQSKEFDLFVEVPKKKDYAGKSFQAIVEVKREKDEPKDLFVLAAQPRVCLTIQGR